MSWYNVGAQAHKKLDEEKAAQALRAEASANPYRFYLKNDGDKALVTFVDGVLIHDKDLGHEALNYFAFHEHNLNLGGKWGNYFVCLNGHEGQSCPICEDGDRASFTALFTVIDHRSYVSPKNGKTYKDMKRLYAATGPANIDKICNLAHKSKGLAGATFEVTRVKKGELMWYPEGKKSVEEWAKEYVKEGEGGKIVTDFTAFDYPSVVTYKDEATLRAMGFGTKPIGAGIPGASVGAMAVQIAGKNFEHFL